MNVDSMQLRVVSCRNIHFHTGIRYTLFIWNFPIIRICEANLTNGMSAAGYCIRFVIAERGFYYGIN